VIQSLLIANRGEIACRIIRTARAMGIRTVAVYSDADAKALHVRQADEAVHIGPSPARESYLVGEKIIAAALATGAEAIHPGYGFLSENAEFAQGVIDAGLIWVGPAPASITAMGLKDAAKTLMAAAGVPVTPGYMGADQSPDVLAAEAEKIGYPVLIKAVAGGGGKGMRKVEDASDFADALASCQREANASFGNAHVLIEKYIQRPRHIEVQVFGDTHGNIVHLFERDCSLQRRHQKVIEEAPAPGVTEYTRSLICDIAVRAAKAVNYVGAGTIEFIADASNGYIDPDRVWFMEMNTRLQVEHPVTEEITGVDLVEWQLRVASGEPLPKRQDELSINGWAMEARLYAEDPAKGFLPSVGRLEHFALTQYNCRVETGYEAGDLVSPFYDPMLAKLITHAETRDEAADLLSGACACALVWPVKSNSSFLSRALRNQVFLDGDVDTGFIERYQPSLCVVEVADEMTLQIGASEVLKRVMFPTLNRREMRDQPFVIDLRGIRLNAARLESHPVAVNGEIQMLKPNYKGGTAWNINYTDEGGVIVSDDDGQLFHFSIPRTDGSAHGPASSGTILSPMPGRIIAVEVVQGQTVTKGQKLLTLEAMKMEHSLTAPFDGVVAELNAETGAQVQVEALLVRIEARSDKG
jgi:3-methylcrotonyl-CoA carboxylase alpha subunit